MLANYRKSYLIKAYCNLISFSKAKAITKNNFKTIARFLNKYIFNQYRFLVIIVINSKLENKEVVKNLCKNIKVFKIQIFTYNTYANRINKNSYLLITTILAKTLNKTRKRQTKQLNQAFFYNQTLIKALHSKTLFYLTYKYNLVLLLKIDFLTQHLIN